MTKLYKKIVTHIGTKNRLSNMIINSFSPAIVPEHKEILSPFHSLRLSIVLHFIATYLIYTLHCSLKTFFTPFICEVKLFSLRHLTLENLCFHSVVVDAIYIYKRET